MKVGNHICQNKCVMVLVGVMFSQNLGKRDQNGPQNVYVVIISKSVLSIFWNICREVEDREYSKVVYKH